MAAREIASRRQIPEAFVHQVMASLARAGMVKSTRGPSGGHELALAPERITIAAVARAVDAEAESRPHGEDPLIRYWNGLYEVQGTYLRNMTIAGLAAQHRDRQSAMSYSI
jgi:Rrf2 family protein